MGDGPPFFTMSAETTIYTKLAAGLPAITGGVHLYDSMPQTVSYPAATWQTVVADPIPTLTEPSGLGVAEILIQLDVYVTSGAQWDTIKGEIRTLVAANPWSLTGWQLMEYDTDLQIYRYTVDIMTNEAL